MEKQQYLQELAKLLAVKVDTLTDGFLLEGAQLWDSLSIVSTIAVIDRHYQVMVKGIEVEQCKTVGDIFDLIKQRLATKGLNG